MTQDEQTIHDPRLLQAQAAIDAFKEEREGFEERTQTLLNDMHTLIDEAHDELDEAIPDIEAASVEASAEIDDALLEGIAEFEGE